MGENLSTKLLKVVKVAVGIGCAAVAAETIAIGANAAFDDAEVIKKSIVNKVNPAPVKKGLFRKGGRK